MRTFILRSLLFLLLILVFTKVTGLFDNADKGINTNGDALKALKMTEFDSLDMLFIGNSYCYSAVATPLFDSLHKKTFNLGIATSGLNFYRLLWENYSSSVSKVPDTVLLLVSPISFSAEADNWTEYPIHRYLANDLSNEALLMKFHCWNDYPFLLFNSCRKGLENLISPKAPATDSSDYDYIYKRRGFLIDSSITNAEAEKKLAVFYDGMKNYTYNQSTTDKLLQLATDIQGKGSAVIFYETPVYRLNEYFSAEYLAAYQQTLEVVASRFKLIGKPSDFTPDDYRNLDHTNTQGAYKYTRYLIRQLEDHHH